MALIIGHRGAMGYAPENTMASFELGWRMGADLLECDVHLSKDGRVAVIHDETLARTTDGKGRVRDYTFRRLRRLRAGFGRPASASRGKPSAFAAHSTGRAGRILTGTNARIPSLEEFLRWGKSRKARSGRPLGFVVEIKAPPLKYPGIEGKVKKIIRRLGLARRTWIISFDGPTVRRARDPEIRTGLLYSRPLSDPIRCAESLGASGLFPKRDMLSRRLVEKAHGAGLFVATWVVDKPAEFRKFRAWGVDAIATNYPDRMSRLQ